MTTDVFCWRWRSLPRRNPPGEPAPMTGKPDLANDFIENDGDTSDAGSNGNDESDDQFSDEVFD
jgi:hypothetical protein